jgi:hypothetical protein
MSQRQTLPLHRSISLICLCLSLALSSMAQPSLGGTIRRKGIATRPALQRIDTLSIAPGSLRIPGIPDTAYTLDAVGGILRWRHPPSVDTVWLSYRVLPLRLDEPVRHMRFDTVMGKFVVTPLIAPQRRNPGPLDLGDVRYNGSLGRGLSFGNRQDVVLNSTLNLQINGYLGDSILVAAAISDNNIPIQPDGNTQNLNEFDRVFLSFSKDTWKLDMGDLDLRHTGSYFLNFYKRLQGALFETDMKTGRNSSNRTLAAAAVAKGKFTRNIFQGQEGNQGPYRLKGANGELFFIVLAGTERIFIDGVMMQRGQDQDYVINYNTAEVTFTPRQMITKDRRIQVEFEYADRNFLNTQVFVHDEFRAGSRLKLRAGAFLNTDARNAPVNQTLDRSQKQFLADLGDSIRQAFYPSAFVDTFSPGRILYEKRDTLLASGRRDSVYVFSRDPAKRLYALSFIDAGEGRGHYLPDLGTAANGKVYRWISPDPATGAPRGRYLPATLLVAPRQQQVFMAGADLDAGKGLFLRAELAMSDLDVNTFSSRDKSNDRGAAARFMADHQAVLPGTRRLAVRSAATYEHVQASFKPLERLRNVEFNRDWGLDYDLAPVREDLFSLSSGIDDRKGHAVNYGLSGYLRGDGFRGYRHSIDHRFERGAWEVRNRFLQTLSNDPLREGGFLRPSLHAVRTLKGWKEHSLAFDYSLEHNWRRFRALDSLDPSSFSFDILQLQLRSPEGRTNRWGVGYFTRGDRLPFGNALLRTDRSRNVNVYTDILSNPRQQLRINATYRSLEAYTDKVKGLRSERSILGRVEYNANAWKGAVNGNMLYELGSGQEPRRDLSYLEVPAGQGEYAWIDYNADGLQQLNEFEKAMFRDQARFIRIFTPTDQFVRSSYLQFNYSLMVDPRVAIGASPSTLMGRILSKTYLQSSLQLTRKNVNDGRNHYLPFSDPLRDSSLITLDRVLSNTFSYDRSSPRWGIDLNNIRTSGRAFLSYGYETREWDDWSLKARYTQDRTWTWNLILRRMRNELSTPLFSNRNYRVLSRSVEPRLTYAKGTRMRAQAGFVHADRSNLAGGEHAVSNALQTEWKYNVLTTTSIGARLTHDRIRFDGKPNTAVSYLMLDGLLPGSNWLWTVDLVQRLSSALELSVQYEGRRAGSSAVVHLGRAQIRALF